MQPEGEFLLSLPLPPPRLLQLPAAVVQLPGGVVQLPLEGLRPGAFLQQLSLQLS